MNEERFWHWPNADLRRTIFVWAPLLCAWFGLIYGGAWYVTGLHSYRVRIHFDWELHIPFWPWTVLVYESVWLAFLVPPFVMRTPREMKAWFATIAICTFVAGCGFLLLPAEHGYEPIPEDLGAWTWLVHLAMVLNLKHYNMAPSLHVALAVICLTAYANRAQPFGKWLLWGWIAAIAASTLLLHQHHVIDVISGGILGWLGKRFIYDRWHSSPLPPGEGPGVRDGRDQ